MLLFLAQGVGGDGFDPAWVTAAIGVVVSALTSTVAVLYRGQIAALTERISYCEKALERSEQRTEKLLERLDKLADVVDRDMALHDNRRRAP